MSKTIFLFCLLNCFSAFKGEKYTVLTPVEFYEKINSEEGILLDVRLYGDYQISRIPDAVWAGSEDALELVLKDVGKEQNIYLYCYEGGKRGKKVIEVLQGLGYRNLFFLKGGFNKWIKQGMVTDNTMVDGTQDN
jgi:rhodanese-related sulfurtransferase